MKRHSAFTLVELLTVMGIMIVLMGGMVGVVSLLGGQQGAESGARILQSMLVAAREYAVSNKCQARLKITYDENAKDVGSMMYIEYKKAGSNKWAMDYDRAVTKLPAHTYVLGLNDVGNLGNLDSEQGRRAVPEKLAKALTSDGEPKTKNLTVTFTPSGTVDTGQDEDVVVFVVVKAEGEQVGDFAFYGMNPNTGARLVFE